MTTTTTNQKLSDAMDFIVRDRNGHKITGMTNTNFVRDPELFRQIVGDDADAILAILNDDPDAQEYGERAGIAVSLDFIAESMMTPNEMLDLGDSLDDFDDVDDMMSEAMEGVHLYEVTRTARWTGTQQYDDSGAPVGTRFVPEKFHAHQKSVEKAARYLSLEDMAFDKAGRVRAGWGPLALAQPTTTAPVVSTKGMTKMQRKIAAAMARKAK